MRLFLCKIAACLLVCIVGVCGLVYVLNDYHGGEFLTLAGVFSVFVGCIMANYYIVSFELPVHDS